MSYFTANCAPSCSIKRSPRTVRKAHLSIILLLALLWGGSQPLRAQLPCDCTVRWDGNASDSWQDGVAVDISGGGVVGCGQGAGTDGIDPVPGCVYNPAEFDVSGFLNNCFNPDDGSPINLAPPLPGQKITYINFDVRQFGSSFQFQINNQSQTVGWVLFYVDPTLATPGLGMNGLSGDCTASALIADACGINFTGWANSTFTTPAVSKATNYYILVWNADVQDLNNDGIYSDSDVTPQNRDDFNFNFKARYGCGDSDVVLCNLEEGFTSASCSADGSTYKVKTMVNGANGNYSVTDNTGQAISIETIPSPLILTNLGEPMPVVMGIISVAYPAGVDYAFTIAENGDPDSPNPLNSADCTIDISGTAPTCCTCVNPPMLTCPAPVDLGCDPELDANGLPVSLGMGGLHAPGPTLVSVITDAGCSATVTFIGNGMPETTDGCTYTISRMYQARNDCGGLFDICTQEFSWKSSGSLSLSACPPGPMLDGCTTPDEIDAAWGTWIEALSNVQAFGNCNAEVNFSPPLSSLEKPTACTNTEQQISITLFASNDCGQAAPVSCTFTVGAYPGGLSLSPCPADPMLDGCATETEIKDAFSAWIIALEGLTATGGCNPEIIYSQDLSSLVEPSACSTSEQAVSITIYAADGCHQSMPVSCTFTVGAVDVLTVTHPDNEVKESCESQDVADQQFATWIDGFGADGGCGRSVYYTVNGQTLFSLDNVQAPNRCGEAVTATIHANGQCGQSVSATATFAIEDTTPPDGTCPEGLTGLPDPSQAPGPDIAQIENAYTDACGGISVEAFTETELEANCQGMEFQIRHVYIISDDCSNSTVCVVTHEGIAPAMITGTCPDGQQALQCQDEVPEPDPQYIASLYTGADGLPVTALLSGVEYSEADSCGFSVTHTYAIHDNCGNTATCEVTYSGEDTTAPQGICPDGGLVNSLNEVPAPDADWLRSFYFDNCGGVNVQILNTSQTGNFCEGYRVTHNYAVRDECGRNNSTVCSVTFQVPAANPLNGSCPSNITTLQCWADAPSPEAARDTMELYYPWADITYIATTTINNYCQFTIRHSFSVQDPCAGRIICVLEYSGQDLTPPEGDCPVGLDGLACQSEVPPPAPDEVAAHYSDNCSSVHAYLVATVVEGEDCGAFTVAYLYHVYDDCDNYVLCEVTHTGVGPTNRPQAPYSNIEQSKGIVENPEADMTAFPNPTSGELFLELKNIEAKHAKLEVYNAYGRLLLEQRLQPENVQHRLNLAGEGFPDGAYLITLRMANKVITRRVMLSRF